MTVLARLIDAGVQVDVDGDDLVVRPRAPLTDEQLYFLRENKAKLIAELREHKRASEASSGTGEVHRRLLGELESNPKLNYAAEVVDDTDPVKVIIAVRDKGFCELLVDRAKWDPIRFLELVEAGGEVSS